MYAFTQHIILCLHYEWIFLDFNQITPNMQINLTLCEAPDSPKEAAFICMMVMVKISFSFVIFMVCNVCMRRLSNQQLGYTSILIRLHFKIPSYSKLHGAKSKGADSAVICSSFATISFETAGQLLPRKL